MAAGSSSGSAWCRSNSPPATSIRRWRRARIDAAEWVGPYDDEKLGFAKVAKYYYYPGWWEGCGQAHNIINLAKWNELPKPYQSAIITASGDAWAWVLGRYDHLNPPALKRLLSGGAQLRAFPQDIMEACYKAANDVYAELSQTNPMFKKMFDSLVPFRSDSYLWTQVAEMGFDNFMVRHSRAPRNPVRPPDPWLRGQPFILRGTRTVARGSHPAAAFPPEPPAPQTQLASEHR